ncbi:MAG: serine acetyltransferase [Armatimonadetes bacterium]|nr:serine acetyltransferase [Armatimonadota bacterium]
MSFEIQRSRTLGEVLDHLLPAYQNEFCKKLLEHCELPSLSHVVSGFAALEEVLFPGFRHDHPQGTPLETFVRRHLDEAYDILFEEIRKSIPFRWLGEYAVLQDVKPIEDIPGEAQRIVNALFKRLPALRELLKLDVQAAYNGDPAALSYAEVILSYPCMMAITTHRIAHELYRLDVPLIPRMMGEYAHSRTGIDIHPGASIGESFFIDHGTGVVIGETCRIGNRVKIYQGVTLGAKSFPLDERGNPIKNIKRHPTIEDDVIIYSGATILGGSTVIGKGSVIGGNLWITASVPPLTQVHQKKPEHEIKRNGSPAARRKA